jgi:starch synthase
VGVPDACFHIDGVEFYDGFSFIKAGLLYAAHLTTVSQTYAREITTPEFGCGLEGILKKRLEKTFRKIWFSLILVRKINVGECNENSGR